MSHQRLFLFFLFFSFFTEFCRDFRQFDGGFDFQGFIFSFFFGFRVLEVDRESVTAPRNLSEPGEKKKKKEHRKKTEPNTHTHTHKRRPPLRRNKKKSNGRIKIRRTSQRWRQNLMGLFGEKKRKRKKTNKTKKKSVLAGAICASFVSLIL